MKSENLIQLSQWQYWWWFWFCFLWSLYFFFINKTIRTKTLKMKPKIYTSFRSHGKWGDFLACIVPSIWCFNILVNSNFILKLTEWQSESTIFTVRIRGRQWYWVYKFELRHIVDLMSVPKNVGRNKWIVQTGNSIEVADDYFYALKIRSYSEKIVDKWTEIQDSVNRYIKTNDPIYLGNLFFQEYEKNSWINEPFKRKIKNINFNLNKIDFLETYTNFKGKFVNFHLKTFFNKKKNSNLELGYISRKFFVKKNLHTFTSLKKKFKAKFFSKYLNYNDFFNIKDTRSTFADLKLDNKVVYIYKDRSMSIDLNEKKNETFNNSRQFKKVIFQKMPILVTKNYLFTIHTKSIKNVFNNHIDSLHFSKIFEKDKTRLYNLNNYIKYKNLIRSEKLHLKVQKTFKFLDDSNLIYTIKKKLNKNINKLNFNLNKVFTKYKLTYIFKKNINLKNVNFSTADNMYNVYSKSFLAKKTIFDKNTFEKFFLYNFSNSKESVSIGFLLKKLKNNYFDLSKFSFFSKNFFFNKLFSIKKNSSLQYLKKDLLLFCQNIHQKRKILNNFFYYSRLKKDNYSIKNFFFKLSLNKTFFIKDYFNLNNHKRIYFKTFKLKINNINKLNVNKKFNKHFSYIFQRCNLTSFYEKRLSPITIKYFINNDDIFNLQKNYENKINTACTNFLKTHVNKIKKGGLSVNFHTTKTVDKKVTGDVTYLTLRQKRYKRKKVIFSKESNFFNFEKNIFEKEYDVNNRPFFGEILKSLDFVPDSNYRTIKKNRFRSEIFSSQLSKRLLRTKKTLVLPAHANIGLISNSYDVIHSWFIPSLGIKIDCVPGRATHHSFYCDSVGFYYGQCAEVCGRFHHHMPIKLCVLPFEHFCIWWNHFGLPKLLGIIHTNKFQSNYGNNKFVW